MKLDNTKANNFERAFVAKLSIHSFVQKMLRPCLTECNRVVDDCHLDKAAKWTSHTSTIYDQAQHVTHRSFYRETKVRAQLQRKSCFLFEIKFSVFKNYHLEHYRSNGGTDQEKTVLGGFARLMQWSKTNDNK